MKDDSELMKRVGRNLKKHRKWQSMSQMDLSKRSGVRHTYISDIERGIRANVSLSVITRLCYSLNISVATVVHE